MSGDAVIYWLINLACDTIGQLALKAASDSARVSAGTPHWLALARSPYLWLGIGAFVLEYLFWLSLLAVVPLAMGLFVGSANVVCVMLGARLWFGERIDRARGAAIALIALGIALVGWGKM
jgi:drug/metabolite transporter (DMT)-like permease